jgi:hypothetical protein
MDKVMDRRIREEAFLARFRILTAAESGRNGPVFSGYRCQFRLGLRGEGHNDGAVFFEGADQVDPGAEAIARILPGVPEYWADLRVGAQIRLHEGSRVVGFATILDLPSG